MKTKLSLDQIHEYFPQQMSFAFCLNQLRRLHIHFLNLGNIVICPQQHCFIIFQHKCLIRIENYKS